MRVGLIEHRRDVHGFDFGDLFFGHRCGSETRQLHLYKTMILIEAGLAQASQLVTAAEGGQRIVTAAHGRAATILATGFPCWRDPVYQGRVQSRHALAAQTPAFLVGITAANMTGSGALVAMVTQPFALVFSGHKLGVRYRLMGKATARVAGRDFLGSVIVKSSDELAPAPG